MIRLQFPLGTETALALCMKKFLLFGTAMTIAFSSAHVAFARDEGAAVDSAPDPVVLNVSKDMAVSDLQNKIDDDKDELAVSRDDAREEQEKIAQLQGEEKDPDLTAVMKDQLSSQIRKLSKLNEQDANELLVIEDAEKKHKAELKEVEDNMITSTVSLYLDVLTTEKALEGSQLPSDRKVASKEKNTADQIGAPTQLLDAPASGPASAGGTGN
jgi:hypothetical protein